MRLSSLVTAVLLAGAPLAARAEVVVTVSHEVKDFAAWKKGFDSDAANREKGGFKQLFLGRSVDNPNVVMIGFTAPSAEAAKGFTSNPKLKEAMEKSGVIGAPTIHVAELVK